MSTLPIVIAVTGVIIIAGLNARRYRLLRDGRWHRSLHGGRMKRFVGGQWQYREMTEDEDAERLKTDIW